MHRTRKNRTLTWADRGRDELQTTPVRISAFRLPWHPNVRAMGWRCTSMVGIPLNGNATQEPPMVVGSTNAWADTWRGFRSTILCPRLGDGQQSRPTRHSSADTVRKYGNPEGTAPSTPWGCEQAEGSEGDESAPRGRFSNTNPYQQCVKAQPREHRAYTWQKNEERKLAEQETKFGSKTEEELHAYAWKSTHMRATQGPLHA
ncbi:hypothetical protein PIB30_092851 [Stylosanthes scabra]|uniref:Uncharacterized protein n=1 Tax=Stylosanthes scabra TaxID=79078 RepID=A0ABU6XXI6_9FABA|nr:hypothetical protein [Stylosanthes scabra]